MCGPRCSVHASRIWAVEEAVVVLDADHRRDRQRRREVGWLDAGDAEMPNQSRVAQLSQGADVLGYRRHGRHAPQVRHVEMIAAKLAEVLLNLAAKLVGPGGVHPVTRRIPARSDLGDDD
jgi:hypothetical protein